MLTNHAFDFNLNNCGISQLQKHKDDDLSSLLKVTVEVFFFVQLGWKPYLTAMPGSVRCSQCGVAGLTAS